MANTSEVMARFLGEVTSLGDKLGPLLVQLPPTLKYDSRVAGKFFENLRDDFKGEVVCEPRHATWFKPAAEHLLTKYKVARVAADPAVVPEAGEPGGWDGLVYFRLHGSPKMYYSNYPDDYLATLARRLHQTGALLPSCARR